MKIYFTFFLLTLTGCGASITSVKEPDHSQYAPVNESNATGGTVSYYNAGVKSVKSSRRKSAYQKMYKHCDGPYRITREYPGSDGTATMFINGPLPGAVSETSETWNIDFECEK